MINYRSFLKFFVLPVAAFSAGIAFGVFIKNNNRQKSEQIERINPPVVLKGCVYNEGQKLPDRYNIVVGFYKNYDDILNSSPVTRTIISSDEKCYSMQIDPNFVITPGFLVSYIIPSNVKEPLPPEKGVAINDWYNAIIFPENLFKNIFLSQKWDSVEEVVDEFVLQKITLPPQERKTLIWNSEQLKALSSSGNPEDKEASVEDLASGLSEDKDSDAEIKKLLQKNGVDLTDGFNNDAKAGYHKLISEYFDYLYSENEKTADSDTENNTPVKQFSFKEYLADRSDKLNQKGKLKKSDLDLEKKAPELLANTQPAADQTAAKSATAVQPPPAGGSFEQAKRTDMASLPGPGVTKSDAGIGMSAKALKKASNKSNQTEETETGNYSINGDVLPPSGIKDLCLLSDKTTASIYVDLFLYQLTKAYPSVPRDYSLHTETPLASSSVDCKTRNFSLNFKLDNKVGKETPGTYLYAYVYEPSSPTHIYVKYSGTDDTVNGVPPSLLSRKENNQPAEIKLTPASKVEETLFSMELYEHRSQNTIDDMYLKASGLDTISKLDPMVQIYRTAASKNDGWARLQALPFSSLIQFDLNDPRGQADLYLPTTFNILSASPDFTTSIPMIKQNDVKAGTATVLVSVPSYLKDVEVLIMSPDSKNKYSSVLNPSDRTNTILLKDVTIFDNAKLSLSSGSKSLGQMTIYPKANRLLIVEPMPKIIKTITGTISVSKEANKCQDCKITLLNTDKYATTNKDGIFSISDVSIIDDLIEYSIEAKNQKKVISSTLIARSMDNLDIKITIPDSSTTEAWSKSFPTSPSEGMMYGEFLYLKSYKAFMVSTDKNISKKSLFFDDKTSLPSDKLNATSSTTNGAGSDRFLFTGLFPATYMLYIISDKILHIRPIRIEPDAITLIN